MRNLYEVYLDIKLIQVAQNILTQIYFNTNNVIDQLGIKKSHVELQEASAHWIFWNKGKGRLVYTQ